MSTEFIVLPPTVRDPRVDRGLLGLGLAERCRKMLGAAGLAEVSAMPGASDLVIWPGELVGPGGLGKELASVAPRADEVVAVGPAGAARPGVVIGEAARAGLPADLDLAYAAALAGVTRRVECQAPAVAVVDRPARRRARAMLLHALRKPIDGLVSRTLNRPVSIAMSSLWAYTPITPNQLTLLTFAIALAGAALMATQNFVAGVILLQFASIQDGCDGEVARLKYKTSKIGAWLDTILDDVSNQAFNLATGYGLWQAFPGTVGRVMMALAIGTTLCTAPCVFFEYRRAIRAGLGADTGALKWDASPDTPWFRRILVVYLAPVVKRDTYYFVFMLAAFLGPLTGRVTTMGIPVFFFLGAFLAAYAIVTDPASR